MTPRKGDPTYVKDTALLLPVVPGAGEVGVGAGAGAGSEVFCPHRWAPGPHAAQDFLGESSQQKSLDEEGLEKRGPKSKRSEAGEGAEERCGEQEI